MFACIMMCMNVCVHMPSDHTCVGQRTLMGVHVWDLAMELRESDLHRPHWPQLSHLAHPRFMNYKHSFLKVLLLRETKIIMMMMAIITIMDNNNNNSDNNKLPKEGGESSDNNVSKRRGKLGETQKSTRLKRNTNKEDS